MSNVCVNTAMLNKHLEEQEKDELALERFMGNIAKPLDTIEEAIEYIKYIEAKYEGYDFEDEIKEAILEML